MQINGLFSSPFKISQRRQKPVLNSCAEPVEVLLKHEMRQLFTTILVIFFSLFSLPFKVHAQESPEKFSISLNSESYPNAVKKLAEISGASILFSDSFFNPEARYSGVFEEVSVEDILRNILMGTSLIIKIKGNIFIISKKHEQRVNLHGFILENNGGETLPFATIYCRTLNKVFSSNENGYYSIPLAPGAYDFQITYLGHKEKILEIDLNDDARENIILEDQNVLPEIIVDDSQNSFFYNDRNKYSHDKLMRLANRAPGLGGSNDLLQIARSLPGVQSGAGGVGGYFIRGGSSDQNLFLLDGVSIYNPFHSLGLTSIFTPHTAKSFQVYKSGFRAQYGDKLSSVIDIKLRDGNENEFEANAGINTQDGFAKIEGPIIKGKASFMAYGRLSTAASSFNNIVRETIFPGEEAHNKTDYFDVIAKSNIVLGEKNELFLTFYKGQDLIEGRVEEEEMEGSESFHSFSETHLSWGNEIISLRWQSLLSPSLFLNTTASSNSYFSDLGTLAAQEVVLEDSEELTDLFFTSIASVNQDVDLKVELDFSASTDFRLKTGIGHLAKTFMPDFGVITEDSEELDDLENFDFNTLDEIGDVQVFNTHKWYHFAEGTWSLNKWVLQLGLRNTYFQFDEDKYFDLQPRLGLDYSFSNTSVLSFSVSKVVQYVHLLSSSEISLPRDLWFPANEDLPPEESWHYNIAFKKAVNEEVEFNTEVYYKTIRNKTASLEINFEEPTQLSDLFSSLGKAKSYGFELLAHINKGKWESSISYSLSKSTLTIPDVNLGRTFDFQFDRRHEWKSVSTFQLSKDFILGLSTYLGTGHPLLVTTEIDLDAGLNPIDINPPGQRNTTRTDVQHRIDISLLYTKQTGKLQHNLKFNLYNSYNFNQPLFYTLDPNDVREGLQPNFSIPVIVSVSYSVGF